ncbi:disulfide bond isomerase, DsbC/G [Thermodesulfatator indicus DSM 15286]|uniref:Disulfide bond isomerase, DsbC/G n=1 Tax=Thermodesulfatator indicus (strain DSM 15286 / JCM 11887 / CIR29812) TaxID=667014 RepID=F8ACT9_THEID|nr:DsbC family protein [Thermodesulfatator indicus]AEH44730.1 disulfide bond isomerase, DsbC/G [Thermodesulfatator indicus DSM 15286]
MKKFFLVVLFFVVWIGFGTSWAACPKRERAAQMLAPLFGGEKPKVISVKSTPIKGLCEVVVEANGRKTPVYLDESGRYLVLGRIIDILARKDLTQERLTELNRLSPEKLKELKKLVAFSVGKGPEVFFITDPDCPHCKRAEKIIFPLAEQGKIKVNVIFMPLEALHPHAKEKAVAIICDKKGPKELMKGYQGTQCKEGEEKVKEALKILPRLGIRGTPTYIFPNGKIHAGVLEEKQIIEMVK